MELKQLEYFMTLSQELHFTRAAEKLGITQPSLSQQIRLLEHEISMPLFDRVGKKTMLTEAGRALLHPEDQRPPRPDIIDKFVAVDIEHPRPLTSCSKNRR